jgi:hypothetical protein
MSQCILFLDAVLYLNLTMIISMQVLFEVAAHSDYFQQSANDGYRSFYL